MAMKVTSFDKCFEMKECLFPDVISTSKSEENLVVSLSAEKFNIYLIDRHVNADFGTA